MKLTDKVAEWISRLRGTPVEDILPYVRIGARIISVAIVFAIASLLNTIIAKIIDASIKRRLRRDHHKVSEQRRIQTSGTILRSITKYALYFLASIISLEVLGLNPTSLLAGAGFAGLVFGFGAQALIKDVMSGFFMLFEDQYAVGDYVKVEGCEGIVEDIQLRITKIRDFGGELHIIPNGNISKVTNYSGEGLRIWIAVTVDIREDLEKAINEIQAALDGLKDKLDGLTGGPTVLGVEEVNELGSRIRIWAKGVPLKHWNISRQLNKAIKDICDEKGIRLASPHRNITIETDKYPVEEEGKCRG